MRQTLPQPILLLLFATPGGLHGTGTQKAALSLDELSLGTQTLCPDVLEQPLLREGWPRDQGRVFPLNVTAGEERKNAHSRFKIALAAGTVSIGRVARTGTNDSKHFVK